MNSYDAVLFIGFGGPERREDVMPFLEIVTRGRGIPKERLTAVAHHYEVIGGASPINEITRRQVQALEKEFRTQGSELRTYIGQRNWHPFLDDTLGKMASDDIKHVVGFIAAAHRCEASHERYIQAVEMARKKVGTLAPSVDYVMPWFDHPLFIEAICERIKEVLSPSPLIPSPLSMERGAKNLELIPSPYSRERAAKPGEGAAWIFTAHSIPVPMAAKSHYVQELETTARLVANKFGVTDWTIAYSSRSGNPQDPWLEPDVCEAIRRAGGLGIKDVLLIPIGFIADHVEILFDLDVEAREAAQGAGVQLYRAATVGDHPLFARMMADVVLTR